MRSLVLSALILASAFQIASGQTFTSGDYQYTLSNGQATITGYTGAGGAVAIPSNLNSYPVVSIGNNAFISSGLVSVIIPNSVTSIGVSAFDSCSGLTTITIPNSVTSIGAYVFYGCTSLTSVTIPNSVTSIGSGAFNGCSRLASVSIPYSVTSIGNGAFSDCTSLTSITIPNSVTSIGSYAFSGCLNLVAVYLPVLFETTYQDFGLTSAQVIFYDASNLAPLHLAGQQSVINNPSTHNLYTATQYNANFNAGKDSVLSRPNSNGLYTTSQIQNMAVGDLVLNRQENGSFILNYDIEQSTDLQNWTPYQALSLPLTNLPTNKAFVRIKAKQ